MLALISAWNEQPVTAGVLTALAVLTKAQAIFVVPAIAVTLAARNPGARALAAAAAGAIATSALVLLPFVIRGAGRNLVQAVSRLAPLSQAAALGAWCAYAYAMLARRSTRTTGIRWSRCSSWRRPPIDDTAACWPRSPSSPRSTCTFSTDSDSAGRRSPNAPGPHRRDGRTRGRQRGGVCAIRAPDEFLISGGVTRFVRAPSEPHRRTAEATRAGR